MGLIKENMIKKNEKQLHTITFAEVVVAQGVGPLCAGFCKPLIASF